MARDTYVDMIEIQCGEIEAFAREKGFDQTLRALSYAREKHRGQYRKGQGQVPYITHPLTVTQKAIALGIHEDAVLAAALLHDVCEDCGIAPEELPVDARVREAVRRMTFSQTAGESWETAKARYYAAIRESRDASVVKVLDRSHNVSTMAEAFGPEKLRSYIAETRKYVLPLAEELRRREPELQDAMCALEAHMNSTMAFVEEFIL